MNEDPKAEPMLWYNEVYGKSVVPVCLHRNYNKITVLGVKMNRNFRCPFAAEKIYVNTTSQFVIVNIRSFRLPLF